MKLDLMGCRFTLHSHCSPCTLKYETIVHYEHLKDCNESDFLVKVTFLKLIIGTCDFDLQLFFLLLLETIAPLNHTLPQSEERNRWSPEAMTEEELTALYFEQLDEQGFQIGSISS